MSTVAKWNDIATDFPILRPNFVNIRDSSCATPRLTSTIRDSLCATPRLTYTLCVTEVEEEDVDVVGEKVEPSDLQDSAFLNAVVKLAFKRGFPKYLDAYQWAPKLVVNELRKFPALHDITYVVLPCVGNDAYRPFLQGELALPLEAYDSSSNALTIIQQRSPVIKGMMVEFAKNMAGFLAGSGKKHIIVLPSLDFGKWQKVDMSRFITFLVPTKNGTDENCEQLGWKKLQEYDPSQKHWKYLSDLVEGNATLEDIISVEDELEEENYYASLPFAALFSFLKAKGLKVTCLLCYCSERDNILDAFQLADAVCKLHRLSHPTIGNNDESANNVINGSRNVWRVPCRESVEEVEDSPPSIKGRWKGKGRTHQRKGSGHGAELVENPDDGDDKLRIGDLEILHHNRS
ncbi:hypothetical protein Fmac_018409 [Flemingia macrophylla]|uniref:Proteasome assembly chaperone 2 n=1 Tax=Flemingia macrophylla TaxID=520843 RepID=A0ABD1M5J1_9FABA